ncbi:uncharacterized protein LDX57_007510 [Aspergillus melleus]|uniref:uncharacterized protein n=1 Tax=Aspergillus melleus TaxID=138277 RepID=UPI001E8ED959|nr:uncharacterized protein LDX57_007510 [Aspergillus melleus]KAH8429839.1 hypothetical protein LDX57_007510 [Aspergillus melleus]
MISVVVVFVFAPVSPICLCAQNVSVAIAVADNCIDQIKSYYGSTIFRDIDSGEKRIPWALKTEGMDDTTSKHPNSRPKD